MPCFHLSAKLGKCQTIVISDHLADEFAGFVIEQRLLATSVGQGIGGTSLALAAEEIFDCGQADAKQLSNFGQSVLTAFICFDNTATQIIRVCLHALCISYATAKRN